MKTGRPTKYDSAVVLRIGLEWYPSSYKTRSKIVAERAKELGIGVRTLYSYLQRDYVAIENAYKAGQRNTTELDEYLATFETV